MSELATRPTYETAPYDPSSDNGEIVAGEVVSTATLEDMFNNSPDAAEASDTREVSPTGASLLRAANRVNTILERRAINKAHGEALKEDRQRTKEATSQEDEAYRMNDRYDARAARTEKLEVAKDKVRGFGRKGLAFLKNAGLITLGAGLLAGEKSGRAIKSGAETAALYSMEARDKVVASAKSGAETAALHAMFAKDRVVDGATFAKDTVKLNAEAAVAVSKYEVGQKIEGAKAAIQSGVDTVKEKVTDTREIAGDMVASLRERLARRKEAALTRKYERHAKWMQFKSGVKEYAGFVKEGFSETADTVKGGYNNLKDSAKERAEKAKWNARAVRTAGRVAVHTFKDTREALKQ